MKDYSTFIYDHMQEEENENTWTKDNLKERRFQLILEELLIICVLLIMLEML